MDVKKHPQSVQRYVSIYSSIFDKMINNEWQFKAADSAGLQ